MDILSRGVELSTELTAQRRELSLARRLLAIVHAAQVLIFAAALATGFLLFYPNLRGALTSGYSTSIREVHRWSGRGQVLFAVLLVGTWARLVTAPGSVRDSTDTWRPWRLTHVVLVIAMALGLAASGVVLSSPRSFSLPIVDYSLAVHLWLTYLSCGAVLAHAVFAVSYPQSRLFIVPIDRRETSINTAR